MNKLVASVGAVIAAVMVSAIVQAAPIPLAEGDAEGEHSFDTAGHWENTTAPEPGSDYLVALGTDAPLRTPIVNITDATKEAFTEFAGNSLTIGTADTPGVFCDFCSRYARLRIPELHLVNGMFRVGSNQIYYQAKDEQALYGTIYVDSTTNNPFAFKSLRNDGDGLSLRGPLVGDEDSAICVKGEKTTYLALCASSPDFKGRIIVESNGKIWPGPQALAENAFGSTPETFMKDAIIFRNGGGFGSSNGTAWDLKAENRGIWVEGSGSFSSQGNYKISMPIGGGQLPEGKYLLIQPHVYAVITVNAPVSVYPLQLHNGRVLFTENATIEGDTPILITGNGYLGSTVDRSFKVDFQGKGFYYEAPMNATSVSVITLEEGSLWAEAKNTCEIRISAAGFPMLGIDGWIPVLKVPTSVKDLSTVEFSCQGASGMIPGAQFQIETDEDGLQTLSVMPPTYYVVHPSTPGHEAVAPYTSWETAATNIADAVAEAANNGMGGRIYVDRGTYDITEPIPFAQRVSNTDRPVSLVGVNRETMERDAEHVILDGGYPARTNRIFTLSNSTGSSLVSLTMQHACYMGTDSQFGNGGVACLHSAAGDFVVTGCRLLENHGRYGGVFQASGQTVTNCYFRGNTSSEGASCLSNPQGAASVDGNYLKVVDCLFEDNGNTIGSGSVFAGGRNTRFYNCTFRRCGRNGGSLLGFSYYSVMQNCLFEDNYGSVSLGCSGDCPFVWSDLVIRNSNAGSSSALALPNGPVERVTVVGCTCKYAISGNMPRIRNFLVVSNTCSDTAVYTQDGLAGNAYCWESGTIVANTANNAIYIVANGQQDGVTNIVRNCVIWGNRTASGTASAVAVGPKHKVVSFTHCDTDPPVAAAYDDGTCFSENPKFFNPFRTGDVRLRQDSPLIGAGLLQDWMEGAVDLTGNPRVVGEAPDIGCYERQGTEIDPPYLCTRAVAKEEDKTGVWTNAVVGLPEALEVAYKDEPLYVKAGTYNVTEPVSVKTWGVRIIGEGPGQTILDGGYPARTNRVFTINEEDVTLRDLTIKNGWMKGTDQNGGGVYVNAKGFTITNCVIDTCGAYDGGGLYWANKTVGGGVLECLFTNCVSDRDGSGLYLNPAKGFVRGTTFADCAAVQNGACNIRAADWVIVDSVFTNCTGSYGGGLRCINAAHGAITNTTFLTCGGKAVAPAVYSDARVTAFKCQFVDSRELQANAVWGAIRTGAASTIDSCYFSRNEGTYGTAAALFGGSVMTNCVFENQLRSVGYSDRGVVTRYSGSDRYTIRNCLFRNVESSSVVDESGDVENCTFTNLCITYMCGRSRNSFRNCLFTGATNVTRVGNCKFDNCSFVANFGGPALGANYNSPAFTNCVFWANTPTMKDNFRGNMGLLVQQKDFGATNRVAMANCVFQASEETSTEAPNMCDADKSGASAALTAVTVRRTPKFVDPENGNFRLKTNSPLKDAALTLDWMTEEATDLDGNPRCLAKDGKPYPDALPDIGCYECAIPAPGFLLFVR